MAAELEGRCVWSLGRDNDSAGVAVVARQKRPQRPWQRINTTKKGLMILLSLAVFISLFISFKTIGGKTVSTATNNLKEDKGNNETKGTKNGGITASAATETLKDIKGPNETTGTKNEIIEELTHEQCYGDGLILIPEHKLALCLLPKIATTTWKFVAMVLAGRQPSDVSGCTSLEWGCAGGSINNHKGSLWNDVT